MTTQTVKEATKILYDGIMLILANAGGVIVILLVLLMTVELIRDFLNAL